MQDHGEQKAITSNLTYPNLKPNSTLSPGPNTWGLGQQCRGAHCHLFHLKEDLDRDSLVRAPTADISPRFRRALIPCRRRSPAKRIPATGVGVIR